MAFRARMLAGRTALLPLFRSALAAVLLALVLAPAGAPAWAQGGASPESLTQSLVGLAARGRPVQELVSAAAARQQRLQGLMDTDPASVLRVAIPTAVRSGLPAAVQAYVEEHAALDGTLEVLHEDYANNTSRYVHFLRTSTERLSLHFAGEAPKLLTGTRVRVTGVRLGQAVALNGGSGSGSVQVLASVAPNTFGAQKTLVILVNFQNNTSQPFTPAYAQSVVFTTTSGFDKENSFQQTWLTGDVAGWFTIALSSTVCDYSTLASQANQAATAAGYNLSNYGRYVYGFPINACSWWGLGTIGGSPSQAWINGTPFSLKVVGHEMGHNFGLYHSHALECGAAVDTGTCSSIEYGDTIDIMGNPQAGHFTAYQKERLGWLNYNASPPITTVGAEGLYSIDAYETAGTNPKALKIPQGTNSSGQKTWYYVEYRQAVGYDSFLSGNLNVLNGVVIHLGTDSAPNNSYLLDLTPATTSWNDPALVLGQSFTDPYAGVTITPVSMSATSAQVQVTMVPQACAESNPTVTVAPSQSQWTTPGSMVGYSVSVKNNDGSTCSAKTFALASTVPSGWAASLAVPSLTLAPGASGSTSMSVTSSTSATDGFYAVSNSATNTSASTFKGSGSATYVVLTSLSISVASDKSSYNHNQFVNLTATVTSGGAPVSGASVTFTVTKPNGAVATGTATTSSTGKATYKLRIQKQDPSGTWAVNVKATAGNVSGTATTSFQVQ